MSKTYATCDQESASTPQTAVQAPSTTGIGNQERIARSGLASGGGGDGCTEERGGVDYTVVAGDTLWGIAARTYGDGTFWTTIRDANRGKVFRNGDLIYVGTVLRLPKIQVPVDCPDEEGTDASCEAVPPEEAFAAALGGDYEEALLALSQMDSATFERVIAALDEADRTWLLALNASYVSVPDQEALVRRIRSEILVQTMLANEGDYYWAGGSGPETSGPDTGQIRTSTTRPTDDAIVDGTIGPTERETNPNEFALWIRGTGPEPTSAGKMNCWEVVMFSAYRAGLVDKAWLVGIHQSAAAAGVAGYHDALAGSLGFASAQAMTGTAEPARGDIVFMNGMAHVALSLGTKDSAGKHEVMSLWILPRDGARFNSTLQRTTIEDINGEWNAALGNAAMGVTFAPNPF